MKLMGRRAWILMALCIAFVVGMAYYLFSYAKDGAAWATYPVNAHLYKSGRLVSAGDIYDRNRVLLATTTDGARLYHDDKSIRTALMHTVGDSYNYVATGLQSAFRKTLTGWNHVTGAYSYDKAGNSITSTVDSATCRAAYEALNGKRGTIGVMNYKNGELICVVSSPSFDPSSPPDITSDPDKYEGVYLNRLLSSSYTPGSVFKLVTAAAALDSIDGIHERSFTCSGELELDGGIITCPKKHGQQDFDKAMVNSCNIAFAAMACEIGAETLTKYAEIAGFNSSLSIDGIKTLAGSFTLDQAKEADIGWSGVGQYKTLTNPMAYLQYVSSIANGGKRINPRILKPGAGQALIDRFGMAESKALSRETADTLKMMMRKNVTDNYGESGLKGYNLCAKTGTAEVGGGKQPHSWFTGFLDSEETPYAFIVVVENGGSGSSAALDAAVKTLKAVIAAAD